MTGFRRPWAFLPHIYRGLEIGPESDTLLSVRMEFAFMALVIAGIAALLAALALRASRPVEVRVPVVIRGRNRR